MTCSPESGSAPLSVQQNASCDARMHNCGGFCDSFRYAIRHNQRAREPYEFFSEPPETGF